MDCYLNTFELVGDEMELFEAEIAAVEAEQAMTDSAAAHDAIDLDALAATPGAELDLALLALERVADDPRTSQRDRAHAVRAYAEIMRGLDLLAGRQRVA